MKARTATSYYMVVEQDENKAVEGQSKEQAEGLSGDEAEEETDHSLQENCF